MKKNRNKHKRPDWDHYFLELAHLASKRSTCLRRKVGAVVVKDKHILSTGYNGAPKNIIHCEEAGCLRSKLKIPSGQRHELCRGLHAEQNAIIQAALHGVSLSGATLYCTNLPCSICAKMIINSGVKNIISIKGYPDDMAEDFLKAADIKIKYIPIV
ncbi:MAG: cytidine/deoxycytidylate deaminase family protein [Candidatus Omnitrophota bacterium]